jgi:hypothetical protein
MAEAVGGAAPARRASLKLVSAWAPGKGWRERVEDALREKIPARDLRYLYGRVFLVATDASPEQVRDWLAPVLPDDGSTFVVEFERWSGAGPAIDLEWLRPDGR